MKRETLDAKARKECKAVNRCEAEGFEIPCGFYAGRGLEWCHIHGRRHGKTRHDQDNCFCGCPAHHDYFEKNRKALIRFVGEDRYYRLKRKAFGVTDENSGN